MPPSLLTANPKKLISPFSRGVCILFTVILSQSLLAEDNSFSVSFTAKKALFSGQVNSEETAQALAKAVKLARPDIEIVNDGMLIDGNMKMPGLEDLKSILVEIGISTHEGLFSIDDDTITISGLTDSMITQTALMIRLEPIQEDRQVITRICIVPTDDLPVMPVFLSDGKEAGPLIDFDPKPTAEDSFEVPGVIPAKLSSLIVFAGKMDLLDGQTLFSSVHPIRLRAVPVMSDQDSGKLPKPGSFLPGPALLKLSPAIAKPSYEALPSVLFSRNTFLLQANQELSIQEAVKQLQEPHLLGKRIIIRAIMPNSGSATFNDWLCQRRGEEVKKILTGRGIAGGIMAAEITPSKNTTDTGEVRLFVLIPPPTQTAESESSAEKGETAVPVLKKAVPSEPADPE